MAIVITILIVFALLNFVNSLRIAYASGRDLYDGGYPLQAGTIHNTIAMGLAASFAGMTSNFYTPYQPVMVWAAVAVLLVNGLLVFLMVKLGDRSRIREEARLTPQKNSRRQHGS